MYDTHTDTARRLRPRLMLAPRGKNSPKPCWTLWQCAISTCTLFDIRLQSVLNAAARLIYRRRRFDHVTSLLRELHWLKSSERVAYKLAVTFYRCLHGLAPSYLAQSVRRVAELDRRRLRSSSSDDVIIPTTRLVTVGDRAFTAAGSRLWNSLPPDIRSAQTLPVFCNRLRTYLFSKCFPS